MVHPHLLGIPDIGMEVSREDCCCRMSNVHTCPQSGLPRYISLHNNRDTVHSSNTQRLRFCGPLSAIVWLRHSLQQSVLPLLQQTDPMDVSCS